MQKHTSYRRQVIKAGGSLRIGPALARYLVLVLLAVFSLLYLVQTAQGATDLVKLRSIEQKKSNLNKELSTLELNVNRLQSIQKMTETSLQQGLVPIGNQVETIILPQQ